MWRRIANESVIACFTAFDCARHFCWVRKLSQIYAWNLSLNIWCSIAHFYHRLCCFIQIGCFLGDRNNGQQDHRNSTPLILSLWCLTCVILIFCKPSNYEVPFLKRISIQHVSCQYFFYGSTSPSGLEAVHDRGFTITPPHVTLRHTTIGRTTLINPSQRPMHDKKKTTFTRDRLLCSRWDLNPQTQQASGHRPTP